MLRLFRKMPLDSGNMEKSRSQLLKKLTSSRSYGDLSWIWFSAEKKGVKCHLIPEIFTALQKLTPQEIADFAEKELASRNYDIFVVGPVDKLDRKKLEKYGEVHQVTPEQIFGY
jgi:predicted Zn-dependent peptidase